MSELGTPKIRFARESDAEGILIAHHEAVHRIASRNYDSDVLNAWSPAVTPERVQSYLDRSFLQETTVVAEVEGRVVGFGAIVEKGNELRAVYVHPDFRGQGVGRALLSELERIAKARGLPELNMDSSITAAPFYRAHGYQLIEHGIHFLRTGRAMACARMKKTIE